MTCRSALDTDAAYGRQPLLSSAPSLPESSWRPAVPRIRLLPRRQVQPAGSLARADDHGQRPWAELGVFEVSCHTGKGVTASGRPSSRETVSVDPRMVPLGTRLVIDKVGPRVAADTTGGAIRGRRLDIWEPSVAACTRFGRRQLRVWQAA
jgi:3D (Asp-Asp-Asp) domain-containing protein